MNVIVKMQNSPNGKPHLNKRQAHLGQYDALTPLDGEMWDQLCNLMRIKQKQKFAITSVGKQGQNYSRTSPKIKSSEG